MWNSICDTRGSHVKKNSTIKSRLKVRGSTAEVKLIYIDRIGLHSSN